MDKYDLLKSAMDMLEGYAAEADNKSLKGFANYILARSEGLPKEGSASLDLELFLTIPHLAASAKAFQKLALKDSELVNFSDYLMLKSLMEHGEMSKTALIQLHHLELPMGMEVIKRLIKQGFVEVHNSPTDKRAKLLHISLKGKKELGFAESSVQTEAEHLAVPLNNLEKATFLAIIGKLLKPI